MSKSHRSSKHHSTKATHNGSASISDGVPGNFLFVVNEFTLNMDVSLPPSHDPWGNILPPSFPEAYDPMSVGEVLRYCNGRITKAEGYMWSRLAPDTPGRIYKVVGSNLLETYIYKSQSIFSCSPLLPVIIRDGDASLGGSWARRFCPCDQHNTDGFEWNSLHFDHVGGLSLVNHKSGGYPFVAGSNPQWMPSLVPKAFRNTRPDSYIPPSIGLGGELPVVLALMAFHSDPDHNVTEGILAGWQNNRWTRDTSPKGYPRSEGSPRGYLVEVAFEIFMNPHYPADQDTISRVGQAISEVAYLECELAIIRG